MPLPKQQPFNTKVQAIRYMKAYSKRYAKYANEPTTVKYVMNKHKVTQVTQLKPGIYTEYDPDWTDLLNISNHFNKPHDEYFDFMSGNSYGVCDGLTNFLEVFHDELSTIPEKVCVALTPIHRSEQPQHGGWRWRKWGPYLGQHSIEHEYLYDEAIDVVWIYHIYVIRDK